MDEIKLPEQLPPKPEQPMQEPVAPDAGDFSVEQAFEKIPSEQESKPAEPVQLEVSAPVAQTAVPATPTVGVQKSETLQQIETILSEDLADIYASLPPDVKPRFKQEGEVVAKEIEGMMFKVKIKSKKVFKLIFHWLKIIPSVNKYFLRQEAKLKTDELMKVKEELDKSRSIK